MAQPFLSLVLACYNEERILETSFEEIRDTLESLGEPYEIIAVDDHSQDGTRAILQRIAERPGLPLRVVLHEHNMGRGATVSDGFRLARGEIAGYLDVDLEVHPRYVPSLVRAIRRGAHLATVRRIYAFQPSHLDRYLMSRGYAFLVRRLLGVPLHDTETGFKFFRLEPLRPILEAVRDPGWFWDTEFMVRAYRAGLHIAEIPGAYVRREDKRSTVRGTRDSLRYLVRLLAFRGAMRRGRL